MNTKTKLKNSHTIEELKDAVKKSKDEKQKTRIRAIIALKKGVMRTTVIEDCVITYATLRFWIKTYNKKGIEGLSMSKGGRPEGNPVWETKVFTKLTKELDKQKQCWSLPMMRAWIKEKTEKDIPEQTIWYHLQLLQYSYKSVRPHPYKGDDDVQDAFKKGP